jgi:hypothetical protein
MSNHYPVHMRNAAQQWFKFHDVGQSPSIRCGHAMASEGTYVFVLGGSLDPKADDIYVFDTSMYVRLVNLSEQRSKFRNTEYIKYPEPPAVLGRPASPQITRERNPDPNGRPLDGAVVRDPEDGVIGRSAMHHVEFSAPDSSSEGEVTGPELERQLSVPVPVDTERDGELVDVRGRLRDIQAQLDDLLLSRRQQVVQYERELASMRAKLEVNESELEAVRLRLADAEKDLTSLDELVVSHDQKVGQLEKELTDMRAELETKESELEAVRSRFTDAEEVSTKGNAKADKFRAQYTTDSMNRDGDQVTRGLMERMEAIEDEIARGSGSKRWNEKSIGEMVCRNEG